MTAPLVTALSAERGRHDVTCMETNGHSTHVTYVTHVTHVAHVLLYVFWM